MLDMKRLTENHGFFVFFGENPKKENKHLPAIIPIGITSYELRVTKVPQMQCTSFRFGVGGVGGRQIKRETNLENSRRKTHDKERIVYKLEAELEEAKKKEMNVI